MSQSATPWMTSFLRENKRSPSIKHDGIAVWLRDQIEYLEAIGRTSFGEGTLSAYRSTLGGLEREEAVTAVETPLERRLFEEVASLRARNATLDKINHRLEGETIGMADQIECAEAEIANLKALVKRLTDVAADLAREMLDPGAEALAAIHCGRNLIYG